MKTKSDATKAKKKPLTARAVFNLIRRLKQGEARKLAELLAQKTGDSSRAAFAKEKLFNFSRDFLMDLTGGAYIVVDVANANAALAELLDLRGEDARRHLSAKKPKQSTIRFVHAVKHAATRHQCTVAKAVQIVIARKSWSAISFDTGVRYYNRYKDWDDRQRECWQILRYERERIRDRTDEGT